MHGKQLFRVNPNAIRKNTDHFIAIPHILYRHANLCICTTKLMRLNPLLHNAVN